MDDNIVARGAWGVVEWAKDARGRMHAKSFYDELEQSDRAKLLALFNHFASTGKLAHREKFKKLRNVRGVALYEFKCHQLRFIGTFAPGGRFALAHAVRKKSDEHRESDLETAADILAIHFDGGLQ